MPCHGHEYLEIKAALCRSVSRQLLNLANQWSATVKIQVALIRRTQRNPVCSADELGSALPRVPTM